jgi:hypothetical protein
MKQDLRQIAIRIAASSLNDELSENLLNRLSGFVDEVERLSQDIVDNSGSGSVWADRKDSGSAIVKSSVEQLEHLVGEFESLSKYIEKQYSDKTVAKTIANLVESLTVLTKSTGGGFKKLLSGGKDKFIQTLQDNFETVQSRIRACRAAVKLLQEKEDAKNKKNKPAVDPEFADFDFGPES